jgi:hypothetical protein
MVNNILCIKQKIEQHEPTNNRKEVKSGDALVAPVIVAYPKTPLKNHVPSQVVIEGEKIRSGQRQAEYSVPVDQVMMTTVELSLW